MIAIKWFFGENDDLSDAHAIRRRVFVEEQNVSEADEYDGTDGACIHVVAYDGDVPVSTGRIMVSPPVGTIDPGTGQMISHGDYIIGRVATLKSHRGRGLGKAVMEVLIKACAIMGGKRQILHAQLSARGFYEKLGFTPYGEEFDECGIPHIAMEHFGGIGCCEGRTAQLCD